MRPIAIVLLALLALLPPALAQVTIQSRGNVTAPVPVPPPPTETGCKPAITFPDGTTTDGCAGAPSGTSQLPTILNIYGTNRPKWSVAGVDYPVGVPAGEALKVPTSANLPAGCTLSGKTVTCSGSNVALLGYDFTGMQVNVTGANIVVANSVFVLAPACKDPVLRFSVLANSTIRIANNSFDGGGGSCGTLVFGTMIFGNYGADSTGIFEYNYFKNTPTDGTQNAGATGTATAKIIQRYNLFDRLGWQGHPDGVQLNAGNFANSVWSFNTFYLPMRAGNSGGNQPLHVEAQLGATITNAVVSYNTVAAPGACNGGANWPTGCSMNFGVACKRDAATNRGANSNTGFKAYGNYVDASGAIAALTNGYACRSTTWGAPMSNIDLKTGGALPTSPK